jgi:hypothetical protein
MFENNSTSIVYTQTCVRLEYNYSLFTLPCQPSSLENRDKWPQIRVGFFGPHILNHMNN